MLKTMKMLLIKINFCGEYRNLDTTERYEDEIIGKTESNMLCRVNHTKMKCRVRAESLSHADHSEMFNVLVKAFNIELFQKFGLK